MREEVSRNGWGRSECFWSQAQYRRFPQLEKIWSDGQIHGGAIWIPLEKEQWDQSRQNFGPGAVEQI